MARLHNVEPMSIKLAIFDFDGTLANIFPLFIGSINDLAVHHDFRQIAPHEVDRLSAIGARDIPRDLQLPMHRVPRVIAVLLVVTTSVLLAELTQRWRQANREMSPPIVIPAASQRPAV